MRIKCGLYILNITQHPWIKIHNKRKKRSGHGKDEQHIKRGKVVGRRWWCDGGEVWEEDYRENMQLILHRTDLGATLQLYVRINLYIFY